MKSVVESNTKFAISLYQKLKEVDGNILFSPSSISTALAMIFAGSRGKTEDQMAETLSFRLEQKQQLHISFSELANQLRIIQNSGNVQVMIANSLWPDEGYPLLTEYLALLEKYYGVLITNVDYNQPDTARGKINAWVEEETKGKIKDLIARGNINNLARLVLVNAIYFKGNWSSQFDEENTEQGSFWVTLEEKIHVPMMSQKREFGYSETNDIQILEMPYIGDEVSFIVLLPKEIDGLAKIEETLCIETLDKWTRNLWEREVEVFLPKIKMQSKFELTNVLESMGMTDAFDADRADFSGMDGIAMFYMSAIIHGACIEVNEEGTEATAATVMEMSFSIPEPPVVFRADRPFMFLIQEKQTGSILFLGKLVDPESAA